MFYRLDPFYRVILALLLASGLTPAQAQFKKDAPLPCDAVESIGTAKMADDGTITLQLRSLWPNPVAEGVLTYAPDDPQYEQMRRHVGGLEKGQSKPLPPFCGMNSEP
jgi:hypothetical protein